MMQQFSPKHFLQIVSHITVPTVNSFQAHIQASIYGKCLVRDLSLQQSLSLLYHFFSQTHITSRGPDCPRAGVSTYPIILPQTVHLHRQFASSCGVFAMGIGIRHLTVGHEGGFLLPLHPAPSHHHHYQSSQAYQRGVTKSPRGVRGI